MFDIKKVEEEARKEVNEEQTKAAKEKIKSHLKRLASARQVVSNLEFEYKVLLEEIGGTVVE